MGAEPIAWRADQETGREAAPVGREPVARTIIRAEIAHHHHIAERRTARRCRASWGWQWRADRPWTGAGTGSGRSGSRSAGTWLAVDWGLAEAKRCALMTAMLLVTWFFFNQPPSSYQVPFDSVESCETARGKVLADAERLRAETPTVPVIRNLPGGGQAVTAPTPAPMLSAVCVRK